jgi:hypothetical protein
MSSDKEVDQERACMNDACSLCPSQRPDSRTPCIDPQKKSNYASIWGYKLQF